MYYILCIISRYILCMYYTCIHIYIYIATKCQNYIYIPESVKRELQSQWMLASHCNSSTFELCKASANNAAHKKLPETPIRYKKSRYKKGLYT